MCRIRYRQDLTLRTERQADRAWTVYLIHNEQVITTCTNVVGDTEDEAKQQVQLLIDQLLPPAT